MGMNNPTNTNRANPVNKCIAENTKRIVVEQGDWVGGFQITIDLRGIVIIVPKYEKAHLRSLSFGGRGGMYWIRTSDPLPVKQVL